MGLALSIAWPVFVLGPARIARSATKASLKKRIRSSFGVYIVSGRYFESLLLGCFAKDRGGSSPDIYP
jgi:hypothetical protein